MAVQVWVVAGWFGDYEWLEAIHATEAGADAHCANLWETRRGEHTPHEWMQGHCKFNVELWEVRGGGDGGA